MSGSIRTFVKFANFHLFPRLVMCFRVSNQIGYKWEPEFTNVDTIDIIFDQSTYQESEIILLRQSSGFDRHKCPRIQNVFLRSPNVIALKWPLTQQSLKFIHEGDLHLLHVSVQLQVWKSHFLF